MRTKKQGKQRWPKGPNGITVNQAKMIWKLCFDLDLSEYWLRIYIKSEFKKRSLRTLSNHEACHLISMFKEIKEKRENPKIFITNDLTEYLEGLFSMLKWDDAYIRHWLHNYVHVERLDQFPWLWATDIQYAVEGILHDASRQIVEIMYNELPWRKLPEKKEVKRSK